MSSSTRPPGRSTLARSKSLRLPRPTVQQQQSKDDSAQPEGSCQLRRHGSMRVIGGAAPAAMSASYHGSLQPEPQPMAARKAQLAPPLPGRRPTRPESKPAAAAMGVGRSSPDEDEATLREHFARLVQEHDRLQVKYGRLRAHLVERECLKEQQQPGPKGPLAPIPEDEADSPDGELPPCVRDSPLLMGLHLEAQRLQQELCRAQRAYWDLVLGSDCGDDSAEVVVDLLSQLEKRDTELSRARGRCDRLSEALAQSEREVAACRDALHDYQLQMEAQRATHEALRSHVHDLQVQLGEAREGCEFLQAERATLAEAQLESEAEMRRLRGLLEAALETSRVLYQRCAKLFAKCQQKSVRLSQLESQLERPIAEATGPSSGQALAQLSAKLQAFLKTSVLFAASHLQLDSEVLDEIMDDLEGSGDEHLPAPAPPVPPQKDRTRLAPLLPLDASFVNGDSEPGSSYGTPADELPLTSASAEHSSLVHAILQAAAGSQLLGRGNGSAEGATRAVNGEDQMHDKLAERRNSCVVERTLVLGVSGEGGLLEGLPTASSTVDVASHQSARSPAVSHTNGFHADDGAITFRPNHCLANGPSGGMPLDNGVSNQGPSDEDAAQSSVVGKPVGTVPPFRTVAATDNKLTTGAGSAGHERAVAELASLSGKLVRIHSLVQARVQERLRTDHEQIEELKQNLDTVCQQKSQCSLEAGELRRQRDQACDHAQRLEQQMASLQDSHAREVELLFQQMGDLKEKNRCLSAVNQEQGRQLQEELSQRGFSSEADAICAKLQLRQELEQLREELLLKDEQLRALAAKFGRFRKAYEDNYQRATDDIDKLDTMLERVIETLEAEPEAVSGCPALRQLLHNLHGGSGAGDAGTPHQSPPSGGSQANRKMPTAL
ncbi:uncharacterized protein LOC142576673 isoform X2 [Dermacentor variabilis]|uniref:uncharacterized protein LOC142576673 isoform X2 n=1 Tax=Dermacentor variabilis TaxID=34621 RepID=UPI003F5C4140